MAGSTHPVAHLRVLLLGLAAGGCLSGCGHEAPPESAAVPVTVYEVAFQGFQLENQVREARADLDAPDVTAPVGAWVSPGGCDGLGS